MPEFHCLVFLIVPFVLSTGSTQSIAFPCMCETFFFKFYSFSLKLCWWKFCDDCDKCILLQKGFAFASVKQ
jgi:hypothetical protein